MIWPMMPQNTLTIGCDICDCVNELGSLNPKQTACCRRCGQKLTNGEFDRHALHRAGAWAVASICMMVVALRFPLLGFSAQGRSAEMTLWDTGGALMSNDQLILGLVVVGLIIVLPLIWLILLLSIGLLSNTTGHHRWLALLARWFYHIRHWNMVEVYVVGMLVSLTKIASLARLELGIAFWALIAFGVALLLSEHSIDRHSFWRMVARHNQTDQP